MCFSDWSFAASTASDEALKIMWYELDVIISVLSWVWIWFAKLAGMFLSNEWIYAEKLWLDTLLWKYRNVVKNIANFWLWFYFVYVIFKWLIKQWKESITENFKKIILWLLIAWIGIQTSRFLTAVVIDVSTITLTAVWSFPSQLVSESPHLQSSIEKALSWHIDENWKIKGKEIMLFPKGNQSSIVTINFYSVDDDNFDMNKFIDYLMPKPDDVWGVLQYLWFYILQTYKIPSLKESVEWENWAKEKETIFNLIIQWWATIVYSIEMVILCVLALMRVVYLWMFIVLSPIAVLMWCIKQSWQKLGDGKSSFSKFMDQINFKSFLINVFRPTIIVLWFGMAMLFLSLMKHVVVDSSGRNIDIGWTTVTTTKNAAPSNGNPNDQTYNTTMDNNLLRVTLANVWKTSMEIIMSIITILLVYFIIAAAVKMWGDGKDFISTRIWRLQDAVTWALGSVPIVPVPWYDKDGVEKMRYIGAGKIFDVTTWKSELLDKAMSNLQNNAKKEYQRQEDVINSWMGTNNGRLSVDEENKIKSAMTTGTVWDRLKNVKVEIDKIKDENGKWMILNSKSSSNNGLWMNHFGKWLTAMNGQQVSGTNYNTDWNDMIIAWNFSKTTDIEKKLKEIFEGHRDRVRAYADFFGLKLTLYDWEHLKSADISKK